jgi:opacity protein-like surface antigen
MAGQISSPLTSTPRSSEAFPGADAAIAQYVQYDLPMLPETAISDRRATLLVTRFRRATEVKMKRRWAVGLLSAILLLSVVGKAQAKGEASIYLGRTYTKELLLNDMTTFGGTIGAFGGPLGFEFGLEYSPTSGVSLPSVDLGASIMNIMGNLVVQIPIGQFFPYGTIGYGVFIGRSDIDLPEEFLGTHGAFNFGFGGKIYFSEHVGIRLDYRRFAIQTGDDTPELRVPFTNIRIDTTPNLNRFMGGVTFRF